MSLYLREKPFTLSTDFTFLFKVLSFISHVFFFSFVANVELDFCHKPLSSVKLNSGFYNYLGPLER